ETWRCTARHSRPPSPTPKQKAGSPTAQEKAGFPSLVRVRASPEKNDWLIAEDSPRMRRVSQNDSHSPLATVPERCWDTRCERSGIAMAKTHLRVVAPRTLNGTVPPRRRPNDESRTREYLTEAEVERLIKAAKANRHGQWDATMVLPAFRHGLRAAEIV